MLVTNPNWDAVDGPDPQGAAERDRHRVRASTQTTVDQDLLAGNRPVDIAGAGVRPRRSRRSLTDPTQEGQRRRRRWPARSAYMAINAEGRAVRQRRLPQGHRVRRRQGVGAERARRPARGGDIATHGAAAERRRLHEVRRPYPTPATTPATSTKAKAELAPVRQAERLLHRPIGPRRDRPNEVAQPTVSIQASLKKVGINATITAVPVGQVLLRLRRRAGIRAVAQPRPDR